MVNFPEKGDANEEVNPFALGVPLSRSAGPRTGGLQRPTAPRRRERGDDRRSLHSQRRAADAGERAFSRRRDDACPARTSVLARGRRFIEYSHGGAPRRRTRAAPSPGGDACPGVGRRRAGGFPLRPRSQSPLRHRRRPSLRCGRRRPHRAGDAATRRTARVRRAQSTPLCLSFVCPRAKRRQFT